jgi:hypothetical protein
LRVLAAIQAMEIADYPVTGLEVATLSDGKSCVATETYAYIHKIDHND